MGALTAFILFLSADAVLLHLTVSASSLQSHPELSDLSIGLYHVCVGLSIGVLNNLEDALILEKRVSGSEFARKNVWKSVVLA